MQIIKVMLKAGVMDECEVNEEGTPQGGLTSPLLTNAYLDIWDEWVTKQWERKKTKYPYPSQATKITAIRKRSNLVPGNLVRYADDFVIVTDTRTQLKRYKGKWIPANKTHNLPRIHEQYKLKIPSVRYRDLYIGFTALAFYRWEKTTPKNQSETPYSEEGRQLNFERTKKRKSKRDLMKRFQTGPFNLQAASGRSKTTLSLSCPGLML